MEIKLKENDILKVSIKDTNGNDTGEYLTFDLEDIELPLRSQESIEQHKRNIADLKNQLIIIDKKQDHKGKKLLSANEEEKVKVILDFYNKEIKALDLTIGEGKTNMILSLMKRKPYITMFDDISELLEPIKPMLKVNYDLIKNKLKDKYSISDDENVLR